VVVAVDIGGRVWLFGPTPEMIRMSFAMLAGGDLLVAILGPLLALPRRWHLPVVLGELAAGIGLGTTGSGACRRTPRRSRSWLTLGWR
jgi:Kef-type K+ transport system membrane component KefB